MRHALNACVAIGCVVSAPALAAGARYHLTAAYVDNGLESMAGSEAPRPSVGLHADALHLMADGSIPQGRGWLWSLDLNVLAAEQAGACDEAFGDDLWTRHRCRPQLVEEAFVASPQAGLVTVAAGRLMINQGGFAARDGRDARRRDSFYVSRHSPFRSHELAVQATLTAAGAWTLQLFDDVVTDLATGGQVSPKSMQPAGTLEWEYQPLGASGNGVNPLVQMMIYDLIHSQALTLGAEWRWALASGWLNYVQDRRIQRLGNSWHTKRLDELSWQVNVDAGADVTVSWRHAQFDVRQPQAADQYVSDRHTNMTSHFDDNGKLDALSLEWRRHTGLIPGVAFTERRGRFVDPAGRTATKSERAVELSLRGRI